MMQTILQIECQRYPFDESLANACSAKVQDIQYFHSLRELQEKKSEMLKKTKLINSPYIIKLLNIYQQDLNLHYIYEYVPQSLCSYLRNNIKDEQEGAVFLKKISYQLMMLISYLVDIKLEIQLALQNLGFSKDEKLKLFMNAKCKMGHKTQFSLVTYYGHCKQNILAAVQSEISRRKSFATDKENSNFSIKGNNVIFDDVPMNYSVYQNNSSFESQGLDQTYIETANQDQIYCSISPSTVFNKRKSTASCINQQSNQTSFLRQTQNPKFGRNWRATQAKNGGSKSAQKQKEHKDSFHFGTNKPKQSKFHTLQDQTRSFSQSRSIRIELQQLKGNAKDKKRKDSYKVKITSMHQYQMDDCNPLDLFSKSNTEEDFIQHLLGKAKNYSKTHRDEEREEEYDIPSPKKFMRKDSTPQYNNTADISETAQKLGEKVKKAKQKAQLVLNRYMRLKKAFSCNQLS